ncbi:UDP-2,4-diacetamido-2,4,6-trideoxy-beta-L-altropyranose hydrolase [bacterium]|nr:UDP-2,4-diacetamido-2,4,6-trideoxy-beta-L-altropyranose hydrolase [bacterium]
MRPRVAIRADANSRIGIGHVMRTLSLAMAFRERGWDVVYLARATADDLAAGLVESRGFLCRGMEADLTEEADAAMTLAEPSDLVIADHYGLSDGWWRLVANCRPLALVDDWGRGEMGNWAHAIINHNVGAEELVYTGASLKLLGSEYAMLRPDLLGEPREMDGGSDGEVLVSFGGSDITYSTPAVVAAILLAKSINRVRVIVGPGFRCVPQLEAIAAADLRVTLEHRPPALTPFLRRACMFVGAAGSTVYEAAYLGVPMILMVVVDNQERIAQSLASRGAAVSLGWDNAESRSALPAVLDALIGDPPRRKVLSDNAMRLVDGLGCARLVDRLSPLARKVAT